MSKLVPPPATIDEPVHTTFDCETAGCVSVAEASPTVSCLTVPVAVPVGAPCADGATESATRTPPTPPKRNQDRGARPHHFMLGEDHQFHNGMYILTR